MTQSPPAVPDPSQQRQALVAKAKAGDPDAQSRMGDVCRIGDGFTPQDYTEALRWYGRAAEQGDATAQNNVGVMHHNGLGVAANMPEAVKWYRLAVAQGLSMAQYNLGLVLGCGLGVPMNEREAFALLIEASKQGHIGACTFLGTLYRHGDGVEKRIPLAAEYHVIAALDGDKDALAALAEYHGEIEAEALNGSLLASLCLAKMYDRGLGVEKCKPKMFAWLMWGGYKGTRDADPDVREELLDMRDFYAATLPDPVQNDAWKLFGQMWSPNAIMVDNRPRDAEGNVIRDDMDHASANSQEGH